MNKISRPLIYGLLVVLVLGVLAAIMASGHITFGGEHTPTLIVFDEDMTDSALGWFIAIPILLVVGMLVMVICAAVAVIVVLALAFAAVLTILALVLAAAPFAIILAIPFLAIYGFIKLIQRDKRTMQAAGAAA